MDFMFLNKDDHTMLDFDARAEIVAKDRFFECAQKYICADFKYPNADGVPVKSILVRVITVVFDE